MDHLGEQSVRNQLTQREVEILRLMAEGLSNKAIAEQLFIGFETVKWYLKQMYSKLHVSSRTQAIAAARASGLLDGAQAEAESSALSHNLPVQTTPFVGREAELAEIARLLSDRTVRLVTILGPGGIGKTRLALQSAEQQIGQFAQALFFVSLAPISSSDLLASAIASAMQISFHGAEALDVQLVRYLRKKHLLLLLDNFEHLLDGADLVSQIVQTAPGVKILATSREPLNLSSEVVFTLSGLDFPNRETPQDAFEYSAVKLFVERAERVQHDFTLQADDLKYVARICRLVEGMPLAILLAAAWIKTVSLHEIAEEIDQSLDFLETEMRDLPARHRSLRAVFDSTWSRLTNVERAVFMKLSVFRGGFTREAAQAVTGASLKTLASLVNKSLLRRDPTGRYEVHELLRQYAEQQLDISSQERAKAHEQHCVYYADFMQRQWPHLRSRRMKAALDEIEIDFENVRTAWRTMVENGRAGEIRKAAKSLQEFLWIHPRYQDGVELFGKAVETLRCAAPGQETNITLGLALSNQSVFYTFLGLLERGKALAEEAVALLRRQDCPEEMIVALMLLGFTYFLRNEWTQMERTCQEGLQIARVYANLPGIAFHLLLLGQAALNHGNYQEARRLGEESRRYAEELGGLKILPIIHGELLSQVAARLGDFVEAERRAQRGLALASELGNSQSVGIIYRQLAKVSVLRGELAEAKHYIQTGIQHCQEMNDAVEMIRFSNPMAGVFAAQGRRERAVELLAFFLKDPLFSLTMEREDAERLLAKLCAGLPAEVFAAACERGKILTIDAVVAELL
jgi:predicted ATPase/DNA-binding CsgD family transcriptional regulator